MKKGIEFLKEIENAVLKVETINRKN